MFKKILIILSCIAICLTLTSCDTGFGSLKYVESEGSDIPAESVIAQNSNYILELDQTNMGIVLTDVNTNQKWSSTPVDDSEEPQVDEYGMPLLKHPQVQSILTVECKNFESDEVNTVEALLKCADIAMYSIKSRGKNGIAMYVDESNTKDVIFSGAEEQESV